jgi:hypothetical protein
MQHNTYDEGSYISKEPFPKKNQHKTKVDRKVAPNLQPNGCLSKHSRPPDHLTTPNVPQKPPNMTDRTPDEVARRRSPRPVQEPRKRDEGDGEVRC